MYSTQGRNRSRGRQIKDNKSVHIQGILRTIESSQVKIKKHEDSRKTGQLTLAVNRRYGHRQITGRRERQ